MEHSIGIACGEGADAYQVVLKSASLKPFFEASQNVQARGKAGESLAAVFIQAAIGNGLMKVERIRNDKLHDGANGEPAVQTFDENWQSRGEEHYLEGKRNDGIHGEPARIRYFSGGKPALIEHYKDGNLNDANGEPAHLSYAVTGLLTDAKSYRDGELLHEFTEAERRAYSRQSKDTLLQRLASFPGITVM